MNKATFPKIPLVSTGDGHNNIIVAVRNPIRRKRTFNIITLIRELQ